MNPILDESDLFFDVESRPLIARDGEGREYPLRSHVALFAKGTACQVGVVGQAYRAVSNREAFEIGGRAAAALFPGSSAGQWEVKRVYAPSTRTFSLIDLMHRTALVNRMDVAARGPGSEDDPYTPFVRVTNSFNGSRALGIDLGFMRRHCSNGMIFEERAVTIRVSHRRDDIARIGLTVSEQARDMKGLAEGFFKFLEAVRARQMDEEESTKELRQLLSMSDASDLPDSKEARLAYREFVEDVGERHERYRKELGPNAYATFNTATDCAARPPQSRYFRLHRDTVERRAGQWLRKMSGLETGESVVRRGLNGR